MNKEDLNTLGNARVDIRDEVNSILANQPDVTTGNALVIAVKNILQRLSIAKEG